MNNSSMEIDDYNLCKFVFITVIFTHLYRLILVLDFKMYTHINIYRDRWYCSIGVRWLSETELAYYSYVVSYILFSYYNSFCRQFLVLLIIKPTTIYLISSRITSTLHFSVSWLLWLRQDSKLNRLRNCFLNVPNLFNS